MEMFEVGGSPSQDAVFHLESHVWGEAVEEMWPNVPFQLV